MLILCVKNYECKIWSVVDGWMGGWRGGWMDGWMDGCKSRVKDCLQQSTKEQAIVSERLFFAQKVGCSGWMDGWMGGWMDGWVDGCKSRVKDCLQQSKIKFEIENVDFVRQKL